MIYFSQRKELADKYKEWIKENNLVDCAFNVISFLVGERLIVETMDAAEFLTEMDRMCDCYDYCFAGCPIGAELFPGVNCTDFIKRYPRKVAEIVKQWSEEHKE